MEQVIPKSLAHAEQSDLQNDVRDLGRWARIATMSCMSVVAIGTSLALPWVLWFAAGVAFATVIFRNHPAEVLYNRFIRRFTHTVALPPTARARKVALGVSGGLLIGAGFAFFFDATQLGYSMGVGVKLFLRLLRG